MKLRTRFIFSHILPILLIVPLIGVALVYLLETQVLLQDLSTNLTEQAAVIATVAHGRSDIWTNADEAANFIALLNQQVGSSISLLSANGDLLAATDPVQADKLADSLDLAQLESGRKDVILKYQMGDQSATIFFPIINVNNELVGIVQVSDKLDSLATSFTRLGQYLLLVLVLALVLGVVVGLILAIRLEKPIVAVTTAVSEIAAGQRTDPIPETGTQETQELARSVNQLSEQLRLLEATRRRFLANIVHELGRPLGALKAATSALRAGAGDDPALRDEFLEGMEQTIVRMEPLLDDLSRLHGQILGNTILDFTPTPLSDWLPPVLLPWRAAAQEKRLQWQADIPSDLPTLEIDPTRMAQVVGNLLSNAIKFTPAPGLLTVSAGISETEAWIRVQDTGPGISAAEQKKIFEAFYRSSEHRRFPQGLGLGLTIAQEIVLAHNGRLVLNSTLGEGSQFTIYLPIEHGPLQLDK
ncbi:MAG: HAMP domain-containing histidine kinase [Anaerolineae bacterium]|nr:HAMP domain-containing histidine kinase [Anaerolineae bacterium]